MIRLPVRRILPIIAGLIVGSLFPATSAGATTPCDSPIVVSANKEALQADCRAVWSFFQQLDDRGVLDDPGPGMWGGETPLSSWEGVVVDPVLERITELALQDKGLVGRIPPELGQLSELRNLDLSYNGIFGTIPAQLSQLTELTRLHLGHNRLAGPIPTHLARLTNLKTLLLFINQFTGPIPHELSRLTALDFLQLSYNQLTGTIPDSLSKLANLEYLDLSDNKLYGSIPTAVLSLTKLHYIDLSYNRLSGAIPSGLSMLKYLCQIHLSNNQLTGTIPGELGDLSNRQCYIYLRLGNNQLTGNIPTNLGDLPNLRGLELSNNKLSGSIPAELGKAKKLVYLFLENNRLSGRIPDELSQLTSLRFLDLLRGNRLTGPVPDSLIRLEPYGADPLRLVPYASLMQDYTLGTQVWNVWFCRTPQPGLVLDQESVMSLLNSEVSSYFGWLSDERFQPEFHYRGRIDGDGRQDCDREISANTEAELPILLIDDSQEGGDYAFGGRAVVAGTTVVEIPRLLEPVLSTLIHEMGHVLGFPHSFGGRVKWAPGSVFSGVHEYDNPMDIMSGNIGLGLTTGTIAVNRYAAGWIDPENVAIHQPGTTAIYELGYSDPIADQMLVIPGNEMGTFTALGVRTATGYDVEIPKEGVEVYGITTGPEYMCHVTRWLQCSGTRRIQPIPPAPAQVLHDLSDRLRAVHTLIDHVHSVGEVFTIDRTTVEVVERIGDRYWVLVTDDRNTAGVPARPFAGRFSDDDGNPHESSIEVVADLGITVSCNPPDNDRYCPSETVTRAQMMAFLARALGQEGDTTRATSRFVDIPEGAWYLPYVERLADLGVVEAYADGSFRPSEPLSRRDMAVFLTRGFSTISPVAEPTGVFSDIPADTEFAAEVEGLFAAGITGGCSTDPLAYCPDDPVRRDQMASFLARALNRSG